MPSVYRRAPLPLYRAPVHTRPLITQAPIRRTPPIPTRFGVWSPPHVGMDFATYKALILSERVGFASASIGNVTGGNTATSPFAVTNTNNTGVGSLRAALTGGTDRWITFDPSVFPRGVETFISLSSSIDMRNNHRITIDSRGAKVTLQNYGITTADWLGAAGVANESNNLIFLNFKHAGTVPGNFDCLTIDGTDLMWLWHLECTNGGDGNVDITQFSDGPSPQGYATIQNCHIHHAQTSGSAFAGGKNCILGNQSENTAEYVDASSSYPSGNGGQLKCTVFESRFSDRQRNPVVANAHVDFVNNLVDDWELESVAVMGLMGHLRTRYNVFDPGSAAAAHATKGVYAWTFAYPDNAKKYKRWDNANNYHRVGDNGTSSEVDNSGGFLNPPLGSFFTLPYTPIEVNYDADSGAALEARLKSASELTAGRAGRIDCDGYYDLVVL